MEQNYVWWELSQPSKCSPPQIGGRPATLFKRAEHLKSRRLDCGTESNSGGDSGAVGSKKASRIRLPSSPIHPSLKLPPSLFELLRTRRRTGGLRRTRKPVLQYVRWLASVAGVLRGFRNGLKPELRTQRMMAFSQNRKNRPPCQADAYSLSWAAVLTKRGACA